MVTRDIAAEQRAVGAFRSANGGKMPDIYNNPTERAQVYKMAYPPSAGGLPSELQGTVDESLYAGGVTPVANNTNTPATPVVSPTGVKIAAPAGMDPNTVTNLQNSQTAISPNGQMSAGNVNEFGRVIQDSIRRAAGTSNVGLGESTIMQAAGVTGFNALNQSLQAHSSEMIKSAADLERLTSDLTGAYQARATDALNAYKIAQDQYTNEADRLQKTAMQAQDYANQVKLLKQKETIDNESKIYDYAATNNISVDDARKVFEGTPDTANISQDAISTTPDDYKWMVDSQAERTGVPASVISAIIQHESSWNPNTRSDGMLKSGKQENSWGLGQINLDAWPNITKAQATDPQFAIKFVADTISSYMKANGGDLYSAIRQYNGSGETTKTYAKSVLSLIPKSASTNGTSVVNADDAYYQALAIIPSQMKNSDSEKAIIKERVNQLWNQGVKDPYKIADTFMGYNITNPDDFSTALRDQFGKANLETSQIANVSRLINSGKKTEALTIVENALMNEAKKTNPDSYIGEATVRTAIKRSNELSTLINSLKAKSPIGFGTGNIQNWLGGVKGKEAQQISTQVTNMVATMRNELSGTAVTKSEEAFLSNLIPDLGNTADNFMTKLNNLKTQPLMQLNSLRETMNIPTLDEASLSDKNKRVGLYGNYSYGGDAQQDTTKQTNLSNSDLLSSIKF